METKIAASILNTNPLQIADAVKQVETWGTDWLHLDIMDGVFVKNMTYGASMVKAIHEITELPLDVHLMINDPCRYVHQFKEAGASRLTFHYESLSDPVETLNLIRGNGMEAGISIRPATPVELIFPYITKVNSVLIMTVDPGFGGQPFRGDMLQKIEILRSYLDAHAPQVSIQVDGGIQDETAAKVIQAGANQLVVGSYLFSAENPAAAVADLRRLQ